MYDAIIVGGGPAGLTLATYMPGKIALLERHPVLGGCHRVSSKAAFVEHGPRVYSGAYVNVQKVFHEIGLDWDDVFVPTDFSPENIDGKRWYQWLTVREIAWLTYEYLIFVFFNNQHGKNTSMKSYCSQKNFSQKSTQYIDTICRFSDGAGADRYSLWEFLSGFDQHIAPFYVPRKPLDWVFAHWHDVLTRKGVDVLKNTNVTKVWAGGVATATTTLEAKKVILCIPPVHADALLAKSGMRNPEFSAFAKNTKYIPYWSVSFFGVQTKTETQKSAPWGIIAIRYPFGVISAAATRFDVPGTDGKTIKEMTDHEVAHEIRRQLGLPEDTRYAFVSNTYHDQSFVATAGSGYFKAKLPSGIAVVGCHNGNSSYHFTSMESAVQNALAYAGQRRDHAWTLGSAVRLILIFTILLYLLKNP